MNLISYFLIRVLQQDFYCHKNQPPTGKFHFNILIDINIDNRKELKLASKIYALKGNLYNKKIFIYF